MAERRYFVVDDEPTILSVISTFLTRLDPKCSVETFIKPLDALKRVRTNPPDAIISDQMMPGMSGSRLLNEVRLIAPETIRIIISGFVEASDLAQITSAHRYLCKPFDFRHLRDAITTPFHARDAISDPEARRAMLSLTSVPSLPSIFNELMQELNREDSSSDTVAQIILKDAGISSRLIHLANAPMFGCSMVVAHPLEAVNVVGTEVTKAVVLAQRLSENYARLRCEHLDIPKLWTHCWDTAQLARQIALDKKLGALAGQSGFLAGLMHELGTLVLLDHYPSAFSDALAEARSKGTLLSDALHSRVKIRPAELSTYIMLLWGLPESMTELMGAFTAAPTKANSRFTAADALFIADVLSTQRVPYSHLPPREFDQEYLKKLDCNEDIETWKELPIGSMAH